jgi:hypothetical protein
MIPGASPYHYVWDPLFEREKSHTVSTISGKVSEKLTKIRILPDMLEV